MCPLVDCITGYDLLLYYKLCKFEWNPGIIVVRIISIIIGGGRRRHYTATPNEYPPIIFLGVTEVSDVNPLEASFFLIGQPGK